MSRDGFSNEYYELAWPQIASSISPQEEERIKETLSLIPGDCSSILDVGCGDGRITNRLTSHYNKVVGLESSREALRYVKAQNILGSVDSLPFPDKSFDLILCCEVLEHLIKGSKVLIMGLTYKENVTDTRETPVKEIIKELKEFGIDIYGYDPLLDDIEAEFGIKPYDPRLLTLDSQLPRHCEERSDVAISSNSTNAANSINSSNPVDCVILAVAHDAFKKITLDNLKAIMNNNPILIDLRGIFDAEQAKEMGYYYETL